MTSKCRDMRDCSYISICLSAASNFSKGVLYPITLQSTEGAQMNLSIESDEDFIRCIHPVSAMVVFLKTKDWKTQLYRIDPMGHW